MLKEVPNGFILACNQNWGIDHISICYSECGITSTCSNTTYTRTNANSLWCDTFKTSKFSTWWLLFPDSKCAVTGADVHIQPGQYTSHHRNRNKILYLMNTTENLQFCNSCYRKNNTGTSSSQLPNTYSEKISQYSCYSRISNWLLLDQMLLRNKFFAGQNKKFAYMWSEESNFVVTSPTNQIQEIVLIPRWMLSLATNIIRKVLQKLI